MFQLIRIVKRNWLRWVLAFFAMGFFGIVVDVIVYQASGESWWDWMPGGFGGLGLFLYIVRGRDQAYTGALGLDNE